MILRVSKNGFIESQNLPLHGLRKLAKNFNDANQPTIPMVHLTPAERLVRFIETIKSPGMEYEDIEKAAVDFGIEVKVKEGGRFVSYTPLEKWNPLTQRTAVFTTVSQSTYPSRDRPLHLREIDTPEND